MMEKAWNDLLNMKKEGIIHHERVSIKHKREFFHAVALHHVNGRKWAWASSDSLFADRKDVHDYGDRFSFGAWVEI